MINHVFILLCAVFLDVETYFCHTANLISSFVDKTRAYISPASGLSLVYVSLYLGMIKNYILQDG